MAVGLAASLVAWLVLTLLPSQAPTSTAAETETTEMVKITTTPIFPQIPRAQESKDFQVLVRVQAPPAADKGRFPIDLAVALNVGAGAGSTARLDSVKEAVKFVISQLHGDDRLAIVGPATKQLFTNLQGATGSPDTPDGRSSAESFVDSLEPRGVRARSASASVLEEAMDALEQLPVVAGTRASFVILVTDTTEDSSSVRFISNQQQGGGFHMIRPAVHTIGLGAAHDPVALHKIAKESHGTYSFVDERTTDGITGAVAVCLSGIKDVVAVGARVSLKSVAENGVRIEAIKSSGYMSTVENTKTSGEVAVGVLYAGEVKSFMVHLSVPAVTSASTCLDGCCGCDNQKLLTATFEFDYTTTSGGGLASPLFRFVAEAILSVQRPAPEAAAITMQQRVPFPVVVNHIAQIAVLEMVETFVIKNEILLLNSITITSEVASAAMAFELQSQWEEFVLMHQFWSGLDLGVLHIEISQMLSNLHAAAAAGGGSSSLSVSVTAYAYMLSWLSSYQMQRPTAMGSSNSVSTTFVTINVQLILRQVVMPQGCTRHCPRCKSCVNPLPSPVFLPSGLNDGTYIVNAKYPGVLLEVINKAMDQMYQALIEASDLRHCDSTQFVGELPRDGV